MRQTLVEAARFGLLGVVSFGTPVLCVFACIIEVQTLGLWSIATIPVTAFVGFGTIAAVMEWGTRPR